LEKYNESCSLQIELIKINNLFDIINIPVKNQLNKKDKPSEKIIYSMNESKNNLNQKIQELNSIFIHIFNKFNFFLAQELENNNLQIDDLFENLKKVDDKDAKYIVELNNQ
jgi:archaellum component FlaC